MHLNLIYVYLSLGLWADERDLFASSQIGGNAGESVPYSHCFFHTHNLGCYSQSCVEICAHSIGWSSREALSTFWHLLYQRHHKRGFYVRHPNSSSGELKECLAVIRVWRSNFHLVNLLFMLWRSTWERKCTLAFTERCDVYAFCMNNLERCLCLSSK